MRWVFQLIALTYFVCVLETLHVVNVIILMETFCLPLMAVFCSQRKK